MPAITAVDAWEVLDSRGDPTVRVRVEAGDAAGDFTVPAGASTGSHEAVERRDGGARYGGRGVREAVRAVREDLAPVVEGRAVAEQRGIDAALVDADGTDRLSALGANAVLGASGAVAHAGAAARRVPLYEHLAACYGREPGRLPRPMVNVVSGGLHAAGGVAVQDYLAVPLAATDYPEAIETVWAVRNAVRERVLARGERPLVADEGGFSPALDAPEAGFDLLVAGIEDAGYEPGTEVGIAVDVAATHLREDGAYALEDGRLDRVAMCDRVASWVADYPVVSVEDPLAEDDWTGWRALADRLPGDVQLLGDDLLVTDPDRVDRAADRGAANAVLVKPNQAGTVTRAVRVVDRARERGFAPVVSARSGETCDATIADLAVAFDAGQIKVGSLARSERLAKYNRLFGIAHRDSAREFPAPGHLG
jgi:enolase